LYNEHIIRKREVLVALLPCNLYRFGWWLSKLILKVGHPIASYGAGWFFCVPIAFFEKDRQQLHEQSLSKPLSDTLEMSPDYHLPSKNRKKRDNQPPSQFPVASLFYHFATALTPFKIRQTSGGACHHNTNSRTNSR
jgi:hypothetical protein